jgi:hypothetical protein
MPAGFNSAADLLTRTADGRDLNELWSDYQEVLAQWNADRNRLINFLTFPVTEAVEDLPIIGQTGADFEEASEYGVPKGYRPEVGTYSFGYDFKWYDIASRFTWQFLSDAPSSQVDAIANQVLEADNRLVFTKTMRRIFNPTNNLASIRGNAYNVYTFYNGVAEEAPPPYKGNTFTTTHNHFLVSGEANAYAPDDIEALLRTLTEHGYDDLNGYRIVLMMNSANTSLIKTFRYGVNNADYDFIPVQGTSPFFLPQDTLLMGSQPSQNAVPGFKVIGQYGPAIIVEEDHIPAGYLFTFATGGQDSIQNPVGFRQHANESLRGMRLVKGPNPDYPLIDSYYVRGFGTGVRHRGAGAVMQLAVGPNYAPPAIYA